MNDPKLVYTYANEEGKRLQRTFTLSEIKSGEDDAQSLKASVLNLIRRL